MRQTGKKRQKWFPMYADVVLLVSCFCCYWYSKIVLKKPVSFCVISEHLEGHYTNVFLPVRFSLLLVNKL